MGKIIRGPWGRSLIFEAVMAQIEAEAKAKTEAEAKPQAPPKAMTVFSPETWAKAQQEQDEYERENESPVPQVWPVGD